MRIGSIFLFFVIFCGCKKTVTNNESLYFLYHGYGDRIVKIQNLVFRNSKDSYIDSTLMYVGKPIDLKITTDELDKLVANIPQTFLWDSVSANGGILAIHYIGNKKAKTFSFCKKESIRHLISNLESNLKEENVKKLSIDWLNGVQNLYMKPNNVCPLAPSVS